ncbi:MAG: M56 family metallopeptidase [Oscillospiraceae bacterium]
MVEWIVSSSVLIAVVALLRFFLKGRISLRLQYALWALVLLRLLVPVSFGGTALSIENLTQKAAAAGEVRYVSDLAQSTLPRMSYSAAYAEVYREYAAQGVQIEKLSPDEYAETVERDIAEKRSGGPSVAELLRLVWLCGAALMGLCFLASNLRLAVRLRKDCRPLITERRALPVYLSDAIETPCLFGLLRPAVYVTGEAVNDAQVLRHAVEHELTHYRHRDNLWAVLRGVCLALHWYNPLVWYAAVLSRNDAELACDEATIRRLGEGERAAYGRTLLRLTCEKRPALLHTATTMTGSGRSIRERISLIVRKPRMAVCTLIAVLLIAAVAAGCTFTGAKKGETPPADDTAVISDVTADMQETVNGIFVGELSYDESWQSPGSYTLTASDAGGRSDIYLCTPERYFSRDSTPGYILLSRFDWTAAEDAGAETGAESEYTFRFANEQYAVTVFSGENRLELEENGARRVLLATPHTPGEVSTGHFSELFTEFMRYAEAAEFAYETAVCTVSGTETDYETVARKLAEQFAQGILDRPGWYPQRAQDAQVNAVSVFDAYYGEENPNFCFGMGLYLKLSEDQIDAWQAGSGTAEPPGSGPYAGYYGWGMEVCAAKGPDGDWHIMGFNTGGSDVQLPVSPEEATAQQLTELYFLTSGTTHDWHILRCLVTKPLEEVRGQLSRLDSAQRRELTDGLSAFMSAYPDYCADYCPWSAEDL